MRRPAALIAAGAAAFLFFVVALLPASVLLRFVPPEVTLSGLEGTVWSGSANSVLVRGKNLGRLRWSSRPWRLALLEVDYAVELQPGDGNVHVDVRLSPGGQLELANVTGTFPLAAIDGLLAPKGWRGTAELAIDRLELEAGFPRAALGSVVVRELTAPGVRPLKIGSFELTLGEGTVGTEAISGRLSDLGSGPMRVRATLELKPDRSYLIQGEVAAGPEASGAVQRNLAFLGPPDSQGRRPFAIEGTL
jgi:general secretion pathway protein N